MTTKRNALSLKKKMSEADIEKEMSTEMHESDDNSLRRGF